MASDHTEEQSEQPPAAADEAAGPGASGDPATADTGSGTEGSEAALRAEAAENWNKYLRAVAELDNLRKRNARELENARKYGVEKLAADLLPVRDSLEAGVKTVGEADPANVDVAAVLEGEQATLRLLDQALDAAGIREIDPLGEPFDPLRHEAMSMLPSPDMEPGSVMAVVQKGYELNDRIVRPARVIVVRAPADAGESSPGS